MAEFELTMDGDRNRLYLKEELAKVINKNGAGKVKGLANYHTVLLYGEDVSYEDVLESVKLLEKDLMMRINDQKRQKEEVISKEG